MALCDKFYMQVGACAKSAAETLPDFAQFRYPCGEPWRKRGYECYFAPDKATRT